MSTITAPVVGKSGYATGQKRTDEEWDKLFASTILPALKNGATMQSQREKYGRSECIRMAARRAGYASIRDAVAGDKTFTTTATKRVQPKVLAKRIADRRNSGDSWNTLKLATGQAADELKALLTEHGYETLATGRVIISARGQARAAKLAAEQAAAEKAAKPKRVRKPKVAKQNTPTVEVQS